MQIQPDAIPLDSQDFLVARAQRVDYKIDEVDDFETLLALDELGAYTTFCGVTKIKPPKIRPTRQTNNRIRTVTWHSESSRAIFMVDSLPSGEIPGYGEVSMSLESTRIYAKNKPLVLNIETYRAHQQQGYGHRRYLAMNAAALLIFGHPLHSREASPLRTDFATRRWEALVRQGLAESYEETRDFDGQQIQRYRFKR